MEQGETEESLREYLNDTGILNAYEDVVLKLLASGPPQHGNVFSFAANEILAWKEAHILANGGNGGDEESKMTRVPNNKHFNTTYSDDSDEEEIKDFGQKNNKQANGTHIYANKTLDKLKNKPRTAKTNKTNNKQHDSDSDEDYGMSRSTSIVQLTKPIPSPTQSLTKLQAKDNENKRSTNPLLHSERAQSDSDEDLSPSSSFAPSSFLQRTGSGKNDERSSDNGNGADETSLARSASGKHMGFKHSADSQSVNSHAVLSRISSNKSTSSTRSTSNHDLPSSLIQRSESAKSINSHHSSTASTPRDAGMREIASSALSRSASAKSAGSIHSNADASLSRSNSAKSVESYHSDHAAATTLARSESGKSVGSQRSDLVRSGSMKSVDTPRSSGSIKSSDSPRHEFMRSGSAKSVDSSHSDLVRSGSATSVDSSYSDLVRSGSAKSSDSPRTRMGPPPIQTTNLMRSNSARSDLSTPLTTPLTPSRQFLFTVTSEGADNSLLLAKAALPASPAITKNPSLVTFPTVRPPLHTAISTSPTPGLDYAPHRRSGAFTEEDFVKPARRRGSTFSEEDIVKPDMHVINSQIADTYGSSESDEEEIVEDVEVEDEQKLHDDLHKPLPRMNSVPKINSGLRRSSIFEEVEIFKPSVSYDENIEDTYDIEDDRASSEILSESGEFERENDNELEFEFEDHSSETEEIDAHEPSDEEYEREQEEAFMRERERRDKLQQMGVMKIDMRTLHKGEKEGAKEGSGRDSEVNSARSSAKDSARDTPRDSPRDSARNSARSSEGDGSQRDSARSSEGEGGHIHTLNNIQIDMSKVPGRDAEQAKKSGSGRGSMGETVSTRGSGPNSLHHVAEGERQFTSSRVTESERHVTNSKPHEPTRGPDWHRQSLTNSFELNVGSDVESDYSPESSPTVAPSFPLPHSAARDKEEYESDEDEEAGEGDEEVEEEDFGKITSGRRALSFNYKYGEDGDLDRELDEIDEMDEIDELDKLDELEYMDFKTPKPGVSRQVKTYEDEYDSDAS